MNANKKSNDHQKTPEGSPSDWLFDAFSEPRTMPNNWDLSGMEGSLKAPGNNGSAHAAAQHEAGAAEHGESQTGGDRAPIDYLNPCSEPRTNPRW